jgi:hypothetical protein
MSVTFTTSPFTISAYAFTCGHDNGVTEHRFGTYADAVAVLQSELETHGHTGGLAVCGDEYCAVSRLFVHPIIEDPAPDVNVSNANAAHLLGLLGFPVDLEDEEAGLYGTASAEDFLGRVLVAQAVNPADAGVPVTEEQGEGMLLVRCGRRVGYSEDRLASLRELADFAISRGQTIQWS